MAIEFASSSRGTLGIEWEVGVIDKASRDLTCIAPTLLERLEERWPSDRFPHVASELLENTVELITSPHTRVSDAIAELGTVADALLDIAYEHGARVVGSGSHPFSRWETQRVTTSERYKRLINRTQWWGRNMMIWGVHVHVGIDRQDRVVPLMHAVLAHVAHLQAFSASSPMWAGEATGYASNRALMFQQLPTAGLPVDLDSWHDFERVVDDLSRTGTIKEPTEVRWDVRPAPRWGTIELRVCDGASTLWETGVFAALAQCLIEFFQRKLDLGEPTPRLQPWYVRENKWRSARYGFDTNVIIDQQGTQVRLREDCLRLLNDLEPIAADLGCSDELAAAFRILEQGNSSERQIKVLTDNGGVTFDERIRHDEVRYSLDQQLEPAPREALIAVVDSLADEFEDSVKGR